MYELLEIVAHVSGSASDAGGLGGPQTHFH